jgi:DNA-binding transcriptional LysR family regulator
MRSKVGSIGARNMGDAAREAAADDIVEAPLRMPARRGRPNRGVGYVGVPTPEQTNSRHRRMTDRNTKRRYALPPLDLLPAFEVASRTLSFTDVAAELLVSQSAVSKQIKHLEDRLGAPLFERRTRTLALTDAGRVLRASVVEMLDHLQVTVDQLRRAAGPPELSATMTTGFATMWLIPRLPRFTVRHPDIHVRVSATMAVQDMARDRIDVAIRMAPPDAVPAGSPRLFAERTIAVCSPRLLDDPDRPLRSPADLARHTLLRYRSLDVPGRFMDWDEWLARAGFAGLRPAASLTFNQTDQAVQAAIAGRGAGASAAAGGGAVDRRAGGTVRAGRGGRTRILRRSRAVGRSGTDGADRRVRALVDRGGGGERVRRLQPRVDHSDDSRGIRARIGLWR